MTGCSPAWVLLPSASRDPYPSVKAPPVPAGDRGCRETPRVRERRLAGGPIQRLAHLIAAGMEEGRGAAGPRGAAQAGAGGPAASPELRMYQSRSPSRARFLWPLRSPAGGTRVGGGIHSRGLGCTSGPSAASRDRPQGLVRVAREWGSLLRRRGLLPSAVYTGGGPGSTARSPSRRERGPWTSAAGSSSPQPAPPPALRGRPRSRE